MSQNQFKIMQAVIYITLFMIYIKWFSEFSMIMKCFILLLMTTSLSLDKIIKYITQWKTKKCIGYTFCNISLFCTDITTIIILQHPLALFVRECCILFYNVLLLFFIHENREGSVQRLNIGSFFQSKYFFKYSSAIFRT